MTRLPLLAGATNSYDGFMLWDWLQVDHKKLRSLDGPDEMSNLTLVRDPRNRLKSNELTPTELRRERLGKNRMESAWWNETGKWQ